MFAVRQQRFTRVQRYLILRPEDPVTHAVRNVNLALTCQPHHAHVRHTKIGIMRGHHGVALDRSLQFIGVCRPARNHGVRIHCALGFGDGR
jgi:hypothetical protein